MSSIPPRCGPGRFPNSRPRWATGSIGGAGPADAIELVESLDVMEEDLNLDLAELPAEPAPEEFTDLGLDLIVEEVQAETATTATTATRSTSRRPCPWRN